MKIFKNMNTMCAAIIAFFALSSALNAQEIAPEHLALAKKYVTMIDTAQPYERSIVATARQAITFLTQQNPEIGQEIAQTAQDLAVQYMKGENPLHEQYARIYAVRLSAEELQEIIAFYETPTGKKLLENNFSVTQNLQTATRVWEKNFETEFASKLRAQLKEKGFDF